MIIKTAQGPVTLKEVPPYVGYHTQVQAEGAWPSGARVTKTGSLPGDTHQDGARATVLGSIESTNDGYYYFVAWDDAPLFATLIAGCRCELALPPTSDEGELT